MAKRTGRKATTVSIGVRISPRMKHLLDIMARRQRRSLTGVIESAIEAYATDRERELALRTWSTDEAERLRNLYSQAPDLCTFDEEVEVSRTL